MSIKAFVFGEDIVPLEAPNESGHEASANRLDRWLAAQLPDQSRSVIQRWIKEGRVLVNNRAERANFRLERGDRITIDLPDGPRAPSLEAEAIPLSILFEDQDIVVVNKPSGLVVHPAPGHGAGTLVNAILHYIPDLAGIGGEARPGIAHRLDKDTSGIMVVAKHEAALRNLQAQFKRRNVKKEYIALVEGSLKQEQGHIVAPIGRDPRDRKRMAVILGETSTAISARPASTDFKSLARYTVPVQNDLGRGSFTLVSVYPITGRTHQIRVHFAWLGHPIVGDPIYGLKRQRLSVPRLFLHAVRLAFALPSTGEWTEFAAPLPGDLESVIARLEELTLDQA